MLSRIPCTCCLPIKRLRRLLLVDTETTGLNPEVDQVIEVAAIVYDLKYRAPAESYASLVFATRNEAQKHNNIPVGMLTEAILPDIAWSRIFQMAKRCDAIVAHRADFDRSFSPVDLQDVLPWVCSKYDLVWPRAPQLGEHLLHLALKHDVGVVNAHRALSDCDTLARLFTRAAELGVDLEEMLRWGLRPKKKFISLAPFAQKDIVKAHGFIWDPMKYGNHWTRIAPPEDLVGLPFAIKQVDD